MAKDLTAIAVSALVKKPPDTRRETPDGKVRGLYFVQQPTGAASWALRYRFDGQPKKLTLGAYPKIDLKTARELATEASVAVAKNADPAADKKQARISAQRARAEAAAPAGRELVERAVVTFIERYAKQNTRESSWREAERILDKEIVEAWRGRKVSDIKRSDIHFILDAMVDRGAPVGANRSLAVMKRFFSWCVERDLIQHSPCEGIKAPTATRSRDRVLSDDELREIWKACEWLGWPFGPLVRLLILTGQRRDEVAEITWFEVDLSEALWTLPRGRVKNDKGHSVPLSPQAIEILNILPKIQGKQAFIFSTTGESAVSGFARAKARLDSLLPEGMPGWTLHDLRRTLASGCARLGIAPQVVEAILNHKSGTIRGVAAVYNRYDYASEKRAALDAWAKHIEGLIFQRPTNVVQLTAHVK